MKKILPFLLAAFLFSCDPVKKLPEGEEFQYDVGEVVYYKIDNMPMLIDKRMYKKNKKMYKVVFKNEAGQLLYNVVSEHEILAAPPFNRARI